MPISDRTKSGSKGRTMRPADVSVTTTRSVFHRLRTSAGMEMVPLRETFITVAVYVAPIMPRSYNASLKSLYEVDRYA